MIFPLDGGGDGDSLAAAASESIASETNNTKPRALGGAIGTLRAFSARSAPAAPQTAATVGAGRPLAPDGAATRAPCLRTKLRRSWAPRFVCSAPAAVVRSDGQTNVKKLFVTRRSLAGFVNFLSVHFFLFVRVRRATEMCLAYRTFSQPGAM
jgi:hypothetical protein